MLLKGKLRDKRGTRLLSRMRRRLLIPSRKLKKPHGRRMKMKIKGSSKSKSLMKKTSRQIGTMRTLQLKSHLRSSTTSITTLTLKSRKKTKSEPIHKL